ncbi:MAG: TRAP transporter small permease [Alphaproteobacteria bacterium]|nr:TRAP transporter small permease [Alphaproteobacteria bacterium]
MRALVRTYDGVITGMAVVAGLILAAIFVIIIYDVVVRTLGWQPPAGTSALSEYGMHYIALLAAPWLVRVKGHVFVESLVLVLPGGAARILERIVHVLCIAMCLALAWYSVEAIRETVKFGDSDIRSIIVPKWVLFAPMPVAFVLAAIEFGRFLVGHDTMYEGRGAGAGERI